MIASVKGSALPKIYIYVYLHTNTNRYTYISGWGNEREVRNRQSRKGTRLGEERIGGEGVKYSEIEMEQKRSDKE